MIKVIMIIMILTFNLTSGSIVNKKELSGASIKQFNNHSLILEQTNNNLIKQEVIFTVFRDKTLGIPIKRSELVLNERGIYTYNDKVCVATATYECLNSNSGSCKLCGFNNLLNNCNTNIINKYIQWKKITNYIHIQPVLLTNYYVGDNTGSGSTTSSGLSVNDFQINDLGWYTYKGKIVVAAATYVCLRASTGACAKYKTLPEGYSIFNLYDEITIIYDEIEYDGIVLDSMGAGFWKLDNEPYQRIDIFVTKESKKFGKVVAQMQYYKGD